MVTVLSVGSSILNPHLTPFLLQEVERGKRYELV